MRWRLQGRDVPHRIRAARPQDRRAARSDRSRLAEHLLRPRGVTTARQSDGRCHPPRHRSGRGAELRRHGPRGLQKGASGVQTAYDITCSRRSGIGVADQSAGGSLVVAHFTGTRDQELPGVPARRQSEPAGPVFPTRLGHAVPLRPVTAEIRCRDADRVRRPRPRLSHHRHQRRSRTDLYSLACNLYFGLVLASHSPERRMAH